MTNKAFFKKYFQLMAMLLAMILLSTASVSAQDSSESKAPGENTSVTYTGKIQPLFLEKCVGCHGEASPEHKQFKKDKEGYKARDLGPRMDTYTYLISFISWPDTGAVMRRLDDGKNSPEGAQGNMYQYLGDSEQERQANLQLFKEWIGNWSTKRWKDTSKAEINQMGLAY